MKRLFYSLLIFVSALPLQAQIQNGGFENWSSGEPVGWFTNNIPSLSAYPVTQSSISHSGSSSLKGEVVGVDVGGQQYPYAPSVSSGDMNANYFPFHSIPDLIRGYYNFQPVGGDGLQASILIGNQSTVMGAGEVITYAPTGTGWHELDFHMYYADTVSTPTLIYVYFTIVPPPGGNSQHIGSTFYIDDLPKVTLIKPAEEPVESFTAQTVFISGETDTIKWNSGGAEHVDIEYSVDNGATYQNIASNYPGDSSRYFWKVPSSITPTRKAKIRLTDSYSGREVESINFTIKPWQLTRFMGTDGLELFEPNQDGWNFSNLKSNVWPESWWTRFNYVYPVRGTDPYTGDYYPWYNVSFAAANPEDFPDWELFVDVFGTSACYFSSQVYNGLATTRWGGLILGIKSNWGGSCFGFAISSLLGFYHKGELLAKFPDIASFTDLYNVPLDTNSAYLVNHYFQYQFSITNQLYQATHLADTPRDLLAGLKAMFRKEDGDGRALAFFNNNIFEGGGHEVTPYKMERLGSSSVFNLHVYDSRAPGSAAQIIQVDSGKNQWVDLTGLDWGTGVAGCYLERESGEFLSRPDLFRPALVFGSGSNPSGVSYASIYNASGCEITIESSSGGHIGYQDSSVINEIPGATPVIPRTASLHPPIGYFVPQDEYSIDMNSFSDTSSYVYFISDSTVYKYSRSDASAGQNDLLNISSNGVTIANPDAVPKLTRLETIIINDTTSNKLFSLENVQVSSGDSIEFREIDRNELLIKNYGGMTNYDMQVRMESDQGQAFFLHYSVPLAANSGHQIVPDWNKLESSPVKILIDLGNDGTIDDSIFVDNQTVGIDNGITQRMPSQYHLLQNYPNPFNPVTTITFDLPEETRVNLTVYNILGEQVAVLINNTMKPGRHSTGFNATALPSGIYFYRVSTEKFSAVKKMILIK